MESFNSDDEILEFAIAREVEANQFYLFLADRMKNWVMSQVCKDFAKEELEHKAKLEFEVIKRGKTVSDLKISDYMPNVGDEMDMSYNELLIFAIQKEQVSIDLYTDLAEMAKDEESRQLFLSLVEEETKHKQRFEMEYNKLLKEN